MKPIHKTAGKNHVNAAMNYIQFKGGFAYACNGYIAIKMPAEELLPKLIDRNEELYFDASLWASSKLDKALYVSRDGLLFTARDKRHKVIGVIKALSENEMSDVGRFPDINVAYPKPENQHSLARVCFNPDLFTDLCASFGLKKDFYLNFHGEEKSIIVRHLESKAVGLMMPLLLTGRIPELENSSSY